MNRFIAPLLLMGVAFASCTPKATTTTEPSAPAAAVAPDPAQLNGTWLVQLLRGQALPSPADPESAARLVFDAAQGRVSGSTGCNRLFGTYTATGTSLQLGGLGTTRMACPDPNPETALLAALNTPDLAYKLGADELTLSQGATVVMVLRRAAK